MSQWGCGWWVWGLVAVSVAGGVGCVWWVVGGLVGAVVGGVVVAVGGGVVGAGDQPLRWGWGGVGGGGGVCSGGRPSRCRDVLWCGAVRCGAVWCGAVRCGAVRCGVVRCGAVRCGGAVGGWWGCAIYPDKCYTDRVRREMRGTHLQ